MAGTSPAMTTAGADDPEDQNSPWTCPSTKRIFSAAGTRGSPGIVMMSPISTTTKPAPARRRTSRIGATWPRGARYNYAPASKEILDRVQRIEALCREHDVKLAQAALRFPLAHPAVVSVIPGANRASEVKRNAEIMNAKIPAALWRSLKSAGLLRADAPVPR